MLPKFDHPIFEITIPSSNKGVKVRPFLVREEKLLLIAQSSNERSDLINSIFQIVQNCMVSDDVNMDDLSIYDLEYLFLMLRAKSIGSEVELTFKDNEDDQLYTFNVNLEQVSINRESNAPSHIQLPNNYLIKLKHPSARILLKYTPESDLDLFSTIVRDCLDSLTGPTEVWEFKNYSELEINEFLESLPSGALGDIRNFLESIPRMYYSIDYTNKLGNPRKIILNTLEDFFTFR
jgi:hypothetical protein